MQTSVMTPEFSVNDNDFSWHVWYLSLLHDVSVSADYYSEQLLQIHRELLGMELPAY